MANSKKNATEEVTKFEPEMKQKCPDDAEEFGDYYFEEDQEEKLIDSGNEVMENDGSNFTQKVNRFHSILEELIQNSRYSNTYNTYNKIRTTRTIKKVEIGIAIGTSPIFNVFFAYFENFCSFFPGAVGK